MKHLALVLLAACSEAASPTADAYVGPTDTNSVAIDGSVDSMPVTVRIIVLNEVAPGETPDWIEVVNATTSAVQLADFVYVDAAGDFAKAKAFPAMMLGPGARYVQDIDDTISGFKLASDEAVWIYRASDHALSDGADWDEGAAPATKSWARSPDIFGAFATLAQTRGAANP